MVRKKPQWRRVLTARFLRWWLARSLVRLVPVLGRHIGFFPAHVGLIEAADTVLANERAPIPASEFAACLEFLKKAAAHDTQAEDYRLPDSAYQGRRTVLISRPWIDMATGSILLPDRAKTVLVRGGYANWNATSVRLRRPRIQVAGRVFAPLPTLNYFHMLAENGIRLLDLLQTPPIADEPLTVVKQTAATRVEAAMYDGIVALHPSLVIREADANAIVVPDEAVGHFPATNNWEWPPLTTALAERLAAAFARVYGEDAGGHGERLYLSREGAKLRNPQNEDALRAALEERGFATFVASDANHPEQIARFRAARTIVAVHGAGLTSLVFCTPGTRVIEIFPENFVKSPYWWLARRLGLAYRPVIAGPGDYRQRFTVDVGAVAAALDDDGARAA